MTGHDIIVIGASMGGIETLKDLIKSLPGDLSASLFVVQHTYSHAPALLGEVLGRAGALDCANAKDGEPIRHGRIYVAPPDYHLLLKNDHVRLSRGPKENRVRPAIDPLFRSAAAGSGFCRLR
ncbi:MAG: hypothetical protein CVU57_09395 [Deltaproteobacteria bacterium HGW-Deltaproteobacteria-15]|jgi:two-component system chemotaxis response regulator CheB|nr:MAG: hypothetical protein CVU57_09395 [Deltaproteobacteria bacterium HGW-Deltaproteobacteria-15]